MSVCDRFPPGSETLGGLTAPNPDVPPRAVRRLAEHLAYCPHAEPEDERAGLALRDLLGRLATVFADVLVASGADADAKRQWFARWNEELDRG